MLAVRIASIASLFFLGACAGSAAEPTPSVVGEVQAVRDGRTTLMVGQTLQITLPSNASTGYAWTMSGADVDILNPGSPFGVETTDPHEPGMTGVPGVTTWRFQAAQAGTTTLTFAYSRAWEPNARPTETATYTITVQSTRGWRSMSKRTQRGANP